MGPKKGKGKGKGKGDGPEDESKIKYREFIDGVRKIEEGNIDMIPTE